MASKRQWASIRVPQEVRDAAGRLALAWSADRGLSSSVGVGAIVEVSLALLAGTVTRAELFDNSGGDPIERARELGVLVHAAGQRGWPRGLTRKGMKQRKLATIRELCLCPPEWPIERPTRGLYWVPPMTLALNPWCPMHTDPSRVDRILSPGGLAHAREVRPTSKLSDEELAAQLPVAIQNAVTSYINSGSALDPEDWGLDAEAAEKLRGFGPMAVKAMTKRWVMPQAIQDFFDALFSQGDRS